MSEDAVWIWGRHPVLEALRAGGVRQVLIATGRKPVPILDEIRQAARQQGVSLREASPAEVDRLAPGQVTQGVAAEIVERRRELDEFLDSIRGRDKPPFLLVLDQLQDPHNVGALLRTADAAGVDGVLLPERRTAPIGGTVARASAGAVSHVTLIEVKNLARALRRLKDANIWVIGLDGDAPQSLFEADLRGPLSVVVGSEGEGLRRLTREHCDLVLSIPMFGTVTSLNASVAGAVALYEIVRQRLTAVTA